MRHSYFIYGLGFVLSLGCTTPRPKTLKAQRILLESSEPASPRDWARLGWWRLLDEDSEGAASAFSRAGTDHLAALGRASLARERLDGEAVLTESLLAQDGLGQVGQIAGAWARQAAAELPRDVRSKQTPIKAENQLLSDGHVPNVSYLNHMALMTLCASGVQTKTSTQINVLDQLRNVEPKVESFDSDGLHLSRFMVPDGAFSVRIQGRGHLAVMQDSRVLFVTDLHRPAPGYGVFKVEGSGPIWVAWSGSVKPKLFHDMLSASRASQGSQPEGIPINSNWLNRYLDALWAIEMGDSEGARTALNNAPKTRPFQLARAANAGLEWATPGPLHRKRAYAALKDLKPTAQIHLERARLLRKQGNSAKAEDELKKAIAMAPTSFDAHREYLRLLIGSGRRAEARRIMDFIASRSPGPCALLTERRDLQTSRAVTLKSLVDDLVRCDRVPDAALLLLEKGFPQRALAVTETFTPTTRIQQIRFDALVALERLDEAQAIMADAENFEGRLRVHDMNGGSAESLRRLLRDTPHEDLALELFSLDSSLFPAPQDRFDTERVIEEFEASRMGIGPATRVLDHNLVWMTETGQMVRWIHEIIAIGSREAARFYGEANLPSGARPLMLYTRKADGRRLYTEESPEKESLSFPDLEVGDYLVAQYLQVTDNGYLYKRGFLTPRVWFQGVDMPIFVQRFSVYAPGEEPLEVESRLDAPRGQAVARQGGQGIQFESRLVDRRPAEQRSPDPVFWLPSVRVGRNVSLQKDLDWFRNQVAEKRIRSSRFDDWVQGIAVGTSDPIGAVARAVRENIDAEVGLIAEPVSRSIQTGHGHRGLVLSAALESMGIEHSLVLARPKIQPEDTRFSQVSDFQYALIRLGDGRWLDPGPARAPIGFIPFVYLGSDALLLWPPREDALVTVPSIRTVGDGRTIKVRMNWAEDGTIRGTVVDTLIGQEAIVVGNALSSRTPDERIELIQYLFAGVVPAARIIELEESTTQDPDGPLVMRYSFVARMNQRLAMGLFPVRPGRNFASVQKRSNDIQVELPVDQTLDLELTGDLPFELQGSSGTWNTQGARYTARIDHRGNRLKIRSEMHIDGGILKKDDYGSFARWGRQVDAAEQVILIRGRQ